MLCNFWVGWNLRKTSHSCLLCQDRTESTCHSQQRCAKNSAGLRNSLSSQVKHRNYPSPGHSKILVDFVVHFCTDAYTDSSSLQFNTLTIWPNWTGHWEHKNILSSLCYFYTADSLHTFREHSTTSSLYNTRPHRKLFPLE